jgi:hypothetical protein
VGCIHHLQTLALGPRQGLVVRDFRHQAGDPGAKARLDLVEGGVGVLDGVVEDGGHDEIRIRAVGGLGDQVGDLGQMIHHRLGGLAFAPLRDVPVSGETVGLGQFSDIVQRCISWLAALW